MTINAKVPTTITMVTTMSISKIDVPDWDLVLGDRIRLWKTLWNDQCDGGSNHEQGREDGWTRSSMARMMPVLYVAKKNGGYSRKSGRSSRNGRRASGAACFGFFTQSGKRGRRILRAGSAHAVAIDRIQGIILSSSRSQGLRELS
jgi:hypothetical protein